MAEPLGVRVVGLAELRRALRDLQDIDRSNELRDGLKRAADIVATNARPRAAEFSQRAAETIRATAGGNRVYVVGGKAALPWYGWADFGSRTPRRGQPRSMGPWARSGRGPRSGRFIYPALAATRKEVEDAVGDAVDSIKTRTGF